MTRQFTAVRATRERVPLLIGLTGASSSGKTYSALRLATGIASVTGGRVHVIDTEHRRAKHYADSFDFDHVDFEAPFGPLDYLAAIRHCVERGAGCIVIDSMTHEHSGDGGVLDQSERYLRDRLGDDADKPTARSKFLATSLIKPKRERKALNNAIVQLGVNAIFCYRAADKIKPVAGKEPEKLGWQAETTSPLVYEMTVRFLLTPGSDGRPVLQPPTDAERLSIKLPEQFRGWFRDGFQLDEALGARLADWAAGATLDDAIASATTPGELEALVPRLRGARAEDRERLRVVYAARKAELVDEPREPGEDG